MGIIETIKFTIFPVILLPVLFAIGSQHFYCTISVFISIIVLLVYARTSIKSRNCQTKFFLSWAIASVIYLWIIFVLTVPPDDLLPREHLILGTITFGAFLFFHLAARRSKRRTSVTEGDELQGVTCYARHATCSQCHRSFLSSGPSICTNCQPMIGRWKHYCIWLGCYITERNHFFLLIGHTFGAAGFLFGAVLMIVSVCQPGFIVEKFDMNWTAPVDCSQVYVAPETAVHFMGSIYAAMLGLYCTFVLIHQICQLFIEKIAMMWCQTTKSLY